MNKRVGSKKKIFGIFSFVLGFFTSLCYEFKFTGFAVSQLNNQNFFFFGVILMLGGILLITLGKQSPLEIKLYKNSSGKGRRKEEICMTDPENFFGNEGVVTLETFRQQMREIKKDSIVLGMIKEAYFVPLMNRLNEGGETSKIAEKYLQEMGFEPEYERENESKYALSKEEITRIKKAFTDRKDRLTSAQRDVLKKYNLNYKLLAGGHAKIFPEQGRESITISLSPNDINAGKNNSSRLLKLCDRQYRKSLE